MKRQYIIGCLAGWALWLMLVAIEAAYAASVSDVPRAIRGVADPVMTVVGLAAWPLALGGWFAWGEKYMTITNNMPLNIAIGLAIYGTLGVVVATFIHRRRLRGGHQATASASEAAQCPTLKLERKKT